MKDERFPRAARIGSGREIRREPFDGAGAGGETQQSQSYCFQRRYSFGKVLLRFFARVL